MGRLRARRRRLLAALLHPQQSRRDWSCTCCYLSSLTRSPLFLPPFQSGLQVRAEQEAAKRSGSAGGESDEEEAPALAKPVALPSAAVAQPVSRQWSAAACMFVCLSDGAAVQRLL